MTDHPQIKAIGSLLNRLNKTHTFNWVCDGEEDPTILKNMSHRDMIYEIKDCITSVDESSLSVRNKGTGKSSTLYIVLGNDDSEIVADYSIGDDSLDDIITAHYEYWENK